MNPRRSTAVLRGLTSLAVTAVLLVGVPIALATLVGWPLPTAVPDGDALTRAINTGITDEFVINALAVIAWIAWAQLALAFLAEAVAAFKSRQPRDLPIAPGSKPPPPASSLGSSCSLLRSNPPEPSPHLPNRCLPSPSPSPPHRSSTTTPRPTALERSRSQKQRDHPRGQRLERSPSNGTTPTGPSPNES